MKHFLYLLLILCGSTFLSGQDFNAKDITFFPGEYNSHESFHKDQMGNNFIAGRGTGDIDFDMGPGSSTLPEISFKDLYLVKYDANNNLDWLLSFEGTVVSNQIRAMVSDDDGNIYIGGAFSGRLHLTEDGQNEITSFGSTSTFLAKFDKDGNLIWQFTIGDTNFSQYPDELYIVNNRLIVQLVYSGTFDVDPGSGSTMLSGSSNAMLVYDLDGALVEANTHKGSTNVDASAIDSDGNLYIGGLFSGLVTFDYKSNASILSNGIFDAFLVKYDSNFNLVWLKRLNKGFETLVFTNIAIDSNDDLITSGIFATGTEIGEFTAENDANYLVKVSKEGEYENLIEILPESSFLSDLAVNSNDQIILGASFSEVIDIDPTAEVEELTPMGANENFFLAVYESDFSLAGSGQIYATSLNTRSVHLDNSDELNVLIDFEGDGKVVFGSVMNYEASEEENFVFYDLDIGGCSTTMEQIALDGCDMITINGETITTSGNYEQVLVNAEGCDSILNISVTIYPNYESSAEIESCGPYEIDGAIFTTSGVYSILLTTSQGCDSTVLVDLEIFEVDKTLTVSDVQIVSNENDGESYQWYDCDTDLPIENETGMSFIPQNDGTYRVEITKGACIEFSDCIDFNLVSTKEYDFEITVSPNPSQGVIHIHTVNQSRDFKVSVLDITGKEILSPVDLNVQGVLDLNHLASGLYLIKLENNEQLGIRKVIIK